jgi:membrane fusion protein, multidrug efflux system
MGHQFLIRCTYLVLAGAVSGCAQNMAQVAPAELPVVPISRPVERDVTDFLDFTGRTGAIEAVNIVPRVTGYLVRSPFKEGSEVKEGDLLFEIDARPYQAQLDQAEGQVKLYQAQLELAKTTLARDQEISKTPGAVSLQQLDQDKAAVAEAEARVKAFQASTEVYKLNLSFTKVTAPVSGQISRAYLTSAVGNLVNQDQTLLTTIVSLDPIYVNFDMDEPTLLRVRRAVNEGRIKVPQDGVVPVYMGLQGEDGYPHEGTINFVNNQVNSTTGSISVRGVFPNPKPPGGARLLSPGMFVRVRMPLGQPHKSVLVIDRAIGSDQGLKYVYVVDAENKAQTRRITTGSLQEDGLRVISTGLKANEWVVVGALQQVRPRMEIRPEQIPMPTLARPTVTDAPPPKSPAKPPNQQPAKDAPGSKTPATQKENSPTTVFP